MTPQVNYIECNNLKEKYKMVYYSWGSQEHSNKTLICLHGLNRNGRDWDYVAKSLVEKGYLVIAPDIVGRGNSDYLIDAKGYEVPYYSLDILTLIRVLSLQNISILGTSMGGLIGMAIAAMPEHPIKKLILNDIGAEIEYKGLQIISSYSGEQPEFTTFAIAKDYLKNISLDFGDLPNSVWEHMARNSFQKNAKGNYELKRDVNLSKPFLAPTDGEKNLEFWEFWHKVTLPTLIIRGENSNILSKATIDKMQAINGQTKSIEIKNTGHAPFLYSIEHTELIFNFLE